MTAFIEFLPSQSRDQKALTETGRITYLNIAIEYRYLSGANLMPDV